jgi:hypothetical protein
MFRRKKDVVQNRTVARTMRQFFERLPEGERSKSESVAAAYGRHLWSIKKRAPLISEKKLQTFSG